MGGIPVMLTLLAGMPLAYERVWRRDSACVISWINSSEWQYSICALVPG